MQKQAAASIIIYSASYNNRARELDAEAQIMHVTRDVCVHAIYAYA